MCLEVREVVQSLFVGLCRVKFYSDCVKKQKMCFLSAPFCFVLKVNPVCMTAHRPVALQILRSGVSGVFWGAWGWKDGGFLPLGGEGDGYPRGAETGW